MTNSERREQILKMLKQQGQISVADIASRFGVSKMTGHRDLDFLENRNLLRRVFGGAVPLDRRQDPLLPSGPGESGAPQRCTICMRPPQPHLLYRLISPCATRWWRPKRLIISTAIAIRPGRWSSYLAAARSPAAVRRF